MSFAVAAPMPRAAPDRHAILLSRRFMMITSPQSLSSKAAVDDETRAGHEACIVGGEENDTIGNVGWYAKPSDRMALQQKVPYRGGVVRTGPARRIAEDLITHVGLD